MIENRSAPPGPIVPTIAYDDVSKAIDWLCAAFGFSERLRTPPEPKGSIHHAQLAVGLGSVILTGGAARPNGSAESLMVRVQNVDAHFEHAQAYGARIINSPKTAEFGERQYSAEDLAGHRWVFTESVADVEPEKWGAHVASIRHRLELLPRPRLCYLEIPAADVQRSAAFYENVFGWNIRNRDSGRPSFDDAAGVSGAFTTSLAVSREPGLLPSIWVDSIDDTLARVVANGGEVVEGPHLDSRGGQWIARLRDPAGNVIGLYQEGPR